MKKAPFWKVALSLVLWLNLGSNKLWANDVQVGTLSDGACWYEVKESIKIASFNDKMSYSGSRKIVEIEVANLVPQRPGAKVRDIELALHCGGGGLSLVGRVTTEDYSFCVWSKVENGKWVARSVGLLDEGAKENGLCDGHKWGELIMGVKSMDYLAELQSPKWASMIKEVSFVSQNTYKIVLTHEYEFRESEVKNQLEENFTGKNFIRYLEFNEYSHPVGEFISLK